MLVQKLLAMAQVSGQAVLYLLLVLSVISLGIILERWIYFRRRRICAAELSSNLLEYLKRSDIEGAKSIMKSVRSNETEILYAALGWYNSGWEAVEQVISSSTKERRKDYESGLLFLGTLGNNAPFVGLFGTVLGIVTAFRELGSQQTGAMNNVMAGIAEALVATAVGILVALPAVIAYNYFQKKTIEVEDNVASIGSLILAEMKSVRPENSREVLPTNNIHTAKTPAEVYA
jgi:biopolymer transport protein ExbB/biopolymer transport protein TolQ